MTNHTFSAYGEQSMRWIESPEAVGLRFVGKAHDVARNNGALRAIDHTGWYVDEYQDNLVCGVVYQLSGRGGQPRYLAGHADPWNDGAACLSFDEIFGDEMEAARRADRIAELMAEGERKHACRCSNEARAEEIPDEIHSELMTARALLQDYRRIPVHLIAARAVISQRIASLRRVVADLREERQTLADDPLHGFSG